ncbi:MAG: CCDC90 family protein [Magnetococcus sp. MYC-9]
MTTATFDTLKFVETLRASGFDEPQARGMSAAIQEVQRANLDGLVTKQDLDVKLEKELSPIRTDLAVIKWMLALIIVVIVLPALKTLLG